MRISFLLFALAIAAIVFPDDISAAEKPMLHIPIGQAQPEVSFEGWTEISDMYIPRVNPDGGGGGIIRFPLQPEDYYVLVYVPSHTREFDETSVTLYFNEHQLRLEPQDRGELVERQNWSRLHGTVTADMFTSARSQTLRIVGDGPVFEVDFRGDLPPTPPAGGSLVRTGWNQDAQQFIFPPTFWVKPVSGAASYVATIRNRTGRTTHQVNSWSTETLTMVEEERKAPYQTRQLNIEAVAIDLADIWNRLPATESYVVWINALAPDGVSVGQTKPFMFHKPEEFNGVAFDPTCGYLESTRKNFKMLLEQCREDAANGLPPLGRYRMTVQFPTRIYCQVADGFLSYARLGADSPEEKQDAINVATYFGNELLKIRLEDGPYRGLTKTHTDAWKKGKNWFQPNRGGMAGTTFLKLHEATGNKKFKDAAILIAQTLKSTQLEDGRWVYRINEKTGEVTNDYTSDLSEIILFLDRMIEEEGHKEFTGSRDRVVQWMLDNPVKTMHWPNAYEDTPHRPAYLNLQHWDVEYFIRHLVRHATPENDYQEIAEDLGRWVEDQFVIWETSDLPMWMGPGAKEKYGFRKLDVCGPLLRMYQDLHEGTGNPVYLEKATMIANALTRYQLPSGLYPTFPVYSEAQDGSFVTSPRFNAMKVKEGPGVWPNNTSYTGQWLLEFARYIETLGDFDTPDFTYSPDGRFGIMIPKFDIEDRTVDHRKNQIVDLGTNNIIQVIDANPGYNRQLNFIKVAAPRWSSDSSVLLWKVEGKWCPRALVLTKLGQSKAQWQLDLLEAGQEAILQRTREAKPKQYALIKKEHSGWGSAYPDGFTVDVYMDNEDSADVSLPLTVHVDLSANPVKNPNRPNLDSYLDAIVSEKGEFIVQHFQLGTRNHW